MPLQKAGEIPRESTIYCLTVDDEQADAGRDGRIRLANSCKLTAILFPSATTRPRVAVPGETNLSTQVTTKQQ